MLRLHPHRSPHHRATAAAALVMLATLAGCTSATTAATQDASGAAAATIAIAGAGSTFDQPFFYIAFPHYQQQHPGITISYDAVGSSAGIARFSAGQVNFGATDVPASPADLAGARGGAAVQVPVDLGGVAVAYNGGLPAGLKLTGPVTARIFLGQITWWDDPAITALNPGTSLPHQPVTVVHRSDGSGTTYIFSDYLTQVSPAWAARVGAGRSLRWPAGQGASGNDGVAGTIAHTPYTIGYVEASFALTGPHTAAIQNHAGNWVTPTPAAIAADAATRPVITPASFSIVNQPGPAAYPISGYSWVLLSARQPSTSTGKALVTFISWLTAPGRPTPPASATSPCPPPSSSTPAPPWPPSPAPPGSCSPGKPARTRHPATTAHLEAADAVSSGHDRSRPHGTSSRSPAQPHPPDLDLPRGPASPDPGRAVLRHQRRAGHRDLHGRRPRGRQPPGHRARRLARSSSPSPAPAWRRPAPSASLPRWPSPSPAARYTASRSTPARHPGPARASPAPDPRQPRRSPHAGTASNPATGSPRAPRRTAPDHRPDRQPQQRRTATPARRSPRPRRPSAWHLAG